MRISHGATASLRQGFPGWLQGFRSGVCLSSKIRPLPRTDLPCLSAGLPDKWLRLLHRYALPRSAQARHYGGQLVLVPVWRAAGAVFSSRERIALGWSETVTRVAETGVPDADYEAAAAEFGNKELADLTYAIGLMNAFNRFGVAFRSTPVAAAKA